jgi:hypothetical protein
MVVRGGDEVTYTVHGASAKTGVQKWDAHEKNAVYSGPATTTYRTGSCRVDQMHIGGVLDIWILAFSIGQGAFSVLWLDIFRPFWISAWVGFGVR